MSNFPFVGGSYTARSRNFDAQRCVNLYPELSGSGTSKSVAALYGTPGLSLWANLSGGNVRGLLRFTASIGLAVVGTNVYKLDSSGASTLIGTISAGTTPVSLASNGTIVMMVTGAGGLGYFIDPVAGTVTTIADADFVGGDRVDFIDGYFVWNQPGTQNYQITQLYGTDIDALDFAAAEGSPDLLISLIVDHREIWLFGEDSTEVHYNSGNQDFPFERIQGAFIEHGCAAKNSVAKMDNTVYWLSANKHGQGMVQRAAGYTPERVSTHAVEFAIDEYQRTGRIDDAIAFTYMQEGHAFYVLTFPTADATWVFDAATGLWHERAWRDTEGDLHRHRANCQMQFANSTIVGDWESGKLYKLELDTYSDDGALISRIRSAPHIAGDDYKRIRYHALQVDMEAGVGLSSGQGENPQAMLQWSDDGGHTWSNEHWASFGRIGEYRRRVRWRRLGNSRDRVFRLTITDPVKVAIVGAAVDAEPGTN